MIKVVIYARYSSTNQREASIDDQVEICRRFIEKQHPRWTLVRTYSDAAVSGASRFRPAYQQLLMDLPLHSFDVIVVEALDRLGRKLADVAELHDRAAFAGVKLFAVAIGGEITAMHVGLLGTMAQLFIADLREKTWRGQLGRALQGKLPGGKAYGYDVPAKGDGGAGERRINEAEAATILRIFSEFGMGRSPREIARRLNEDDIPGPGGRPWADTTIRGQAERATGILNNALYVGRLEWNRCSYVKDPSTGKRVARPNPPTKWEVAAVPHLRIVSDELWAKVKARQAELTFRVGRNEAGRALNRAHRTKYLLSGLICCGACGAAYVAQGGAKFACSRHRRGGSCENAGWVDGRAIEARVLAGLKEKLLAPELVAMFVEEFERELAEETRRAARASRQLRTRLQTCERQIGHIVAVVAAGRSNPALLKRLDQLEEEKASLDREIADLPTEAIVIPLPSASAALYRRKVEALEVALQDEAIRPEALEVLRSIIEKVVVTPQSGARLVVELHGDIARLIAMTAEGSEPQKAKCPASKEAGHSVLSVVAGEGFEPSTFRL
jgi:site-specific DNA recombinase